MPDRQPRRTTLRNIIGTLTLKSANSERGKINKELHGTLAIRNKTLGNRDHPNRVKEIEPPKDVQETMNKIVKAETRRSPPSTLPLLPKPGQTVKSGQRSAKPKVSARDPSYVPKERPRPSPS